MLFTRRMPKRILGFVLALGLSGCLSAAETPPASLVNDTAAASPESAAFFASLFAAKAARDLDATMSHFGLELQTEADATHGSERRGYEALRTHWAEVMPRWPATAKSYPTRVLGDTNSAVIAFVDSPEIVRPAGGAEIRWLAAVDFKNGAITRWVGYWDATTIDGSLDAQLRVPADRFVTDLREAAVGENATPLMQMVSRRLHDALAAGQAPAVAALFSEDASYEDATLRTQVIGRAAIARYFARTLDKLPFARGAQLRHVLGSDRGGGYEWRATTTSGALSGITALVLDASGLVIRLTTVYDGRRLMQSDRHLLTSLALDP